MNILGISGLYHDSAACLVHDGKIIAAAQEERFTRKKHDPDFPINAIRWCLSEGNVSPLDLDHVVFYDKPLLKFERILETSLANAPRGIRQFLQAIPLWLKQKLWIGELVEKEVGYHKNILFTGHHESHAASAFYPSPFGEAAFLTMDGVGEWETTSFGVGRGHELTIDSVLHFPHSPGLLYSAFTYYTGFKVNSGEYKLMGLAPYGEPKYARLILDELIDLKKDGSFRLNMKYFGFSYGMTMTNGNFERLFGGPPRRPETKITRKDMDLAASIQQVMEEIMLRMASHVHSVTGQQRLCLSGGVALNCVGNGRILREGPFKEIWVQPASGDAGGALGAALLVWHRYLGNKRVVDQKNDSQSGSLLGPVFGDDQIEDFLRKNEVVYQSLTKGELSSVVAELVAKGNVIGWFQGRMEFGPRALGARSIIGDPRNRDMQSKMNLKIKYRESFRPFAPTVLEEHAAQWFDLQQTSPYMLLVAFVRNEKRLTSANESITGFDKLKEIRSQIPAVTHVDYSARVQTISRQVNPEYYELMDAFYRKTGCPVLINTSFNVRGEPLVCSPEDAFRCFMRTEMDYLVMGRFLVDKTKQKAVVSDTKWMETFELD